MPYRKRYRNGMNRRTGGYVGRELKRVDRKIDTKVLTPNSIERISDSTNRPMNGIAVGTGESQRIAKQVAIVKLTAFGTIGAGLGTNEGLTHAGNTFQIYIVQDRQANKTQPIVTEIWDTAFSDNDGNASRHWEFITRYKILASQKITCQTNRSASSTVGASHWIEDNKSFSLTYKFPSPMKVRYAGTDDLISSIQDYSYTVFVRSLGNPVAYGIGSHIDMQTRCQYIG